MITWIALLVVVAGVVATSVHGVKYGLNDVDFGLNCIFYPLLLVLSVTALVWNLANYTSGLDFDKKVALYNERVDQRNELAGYINSQLSSYPGYEREVLTSFDPNILLSFPNLKASDVLQAKVAEVVGLNQKLYDEKNVIISLSAQQCKNSHNVFAPNIPKLLKGCDDFDLSKLKDAQALPSS